MNICTYSAASSPVILPLFQRSAASFRLSFHPPCDSDIHTCIPSFFSVTNVYLMGRLHLCFSKFLSLRPSEAGGVLSMNYCSGRCGEQPDLNAVLLRHPLIFWKIWANHIPPPPHPPTPPETLTPHVEGICQEVCQSISEVCHFPQFVTALAQLPHAPPRKEGFFSFISFYKTQTRKCEGGRDPNVYALPFL